MKKTIFVTILSLIGLAASIDGYGQIELKKIAFGKFEVPYSYIQYPSTPLGDDFQTYSLGIVVPKNINPGIKAYFDDHISIKGFQKVENGADLLVVVKVNLFDFKEPVSSQNEKYYYLSMQYSYDCQIQLINAKTNKVLNNYDVNSSKNMRGEVGFSIWSKDYSTANERDNALLRIDQVKNDLIKETFKETCQSASDTWTRAYGYKIVSGDDYLLTMKEKEYYYTYFYLRNIQKIKDIFVKANTYSPLSEYKDQIAPYIQYYEEVIGLFQKIQPNVAKTVEAASYYNIAKLYYFYDMPDKSLEYIQKGLETGELKRDLENLKGYNEYLKKTFETNNITNRSGNETVAARLRWN
ncbi:MAG: hypothetical protein LBO74_16335 [Candidatus Symbiothrix sp.]|jgi:hypothetical protein|nr:hypothetical protein [Candidatus Symbiothrix sp.]